MRNTLKLVIIQVYTPRLLRLTLHKGILRAVLIAVIYCAPIDDQQVFRFETLSDAKAVHQIQSSLCNLVISSFKSQSQEIKI